MVLEVYGDPKCAICRTVLTFVALNKIEHEFKLISLFDGDHKKPEFLEINPNGYVPAIRDDGFVLVEVGAILPYLARTRNLMNPWYPEDLKKRAIVDRFLSWFHINLRANGSLLPVIKLFAAKTGRNIDPEEVKEAETNLPKVLRTMDTWVKDMGHMAGEEMTIADLLAVCNVAHFVYLLNYDISNFSNLYAWYKRLMDMPEI
jgi:glutathione S-transferase